MTVREWSLRFERNFAKTLKRRWPQLGEKWFLDEVFIRIRGKLHYLWRAVDQHGNVLDGLVQSRRNTRAAKRFLRKLLKGLRYVRRVLVTDKLRSSKIAKREILPGVEYPLRGLAPTHPTTGAPHEAVQVSPSCPAVPLYSRSDPQSLSAPPSLPLGQ
jgi:transposase-like protein